MSEKYDCLEIKKSKIHGKGVFSLKSFECGEAIAEFKGQITQKDSTHVLWVYKDNQIQYGIKGMAPLKFLNHSNKPNCEFREAHLYCIKKIELGDELCFHYGEEWNDVN